MDNIPDRNHVMRAIFAGIANLREHDECHVCGKSTRGDRNRYVFRLSLTQSNHVMGRTDHWNAAGAIVVHSDCGAAMHDVVRRAGDAAQPPGDTLLGFALEQLAKQTHSREELSRTELMREQLDGERVHFAERSDAPVPALCGVDLAPPRDGSPAALATYVSEDATCPLCRSLLAKH